MARIEKTTLPVPTTPVKQKEAIFIRLSGECVTYHALKIASQALGSCAMGDLLAALGIASASGSCTPF